MIVSIGQRLHINGGARTDDRWDGHACSTHAVACGILIHKLHTSFCLGLLKTSLLASGAQISNEFRAADAQNGSNSNCNAKHSNDLDSHRLNCFLELSLCVDLGLSGSFTGDLLVLESLNLLVRLF